MSGRSWGRDAGLVAVLALVYLIVLAASGALLAPEGIDLAPGSEAPASSGGPETRTTPQRDLVAAAAIALVDTVLFCWLARRSALTEWRLWLCLAVVFFGVKTFTSQLEAWFFMPTVDGALAARLAVMWIPLAVVWSAGVAWAFGEGSKVAGGDAKTQAEGDGEVVSKGPLAAWSARLHGGPALVARVVLLSAVIYPALFFGFGHFVAWQNEGVQAFYLEPAGAEEPAAAMPSRAAIYGFETMRGALWVAMAVPFLLARGSRLERGLLAGLAFALIQNNVHWLSNPLMPGEVRFWHFWETSSSNLLWGLAIVFLLSLPTSRH